MKPMPPDLAQAMLEELQFLLDHRIEPQTRQYSDGTDYEVETIKAYESDVKRIRALVLRATT